jgi:hypothetical protein
MTTSQNPLAGYTQIPKASETIAERQKSFGDFEVLEMDKQNSKQETTEPDKQKTSNAKKSSKADIIQLDQQKAKTKQQEEAHTTKNVVFITPYTDISIDASQVHIDGEIFSLVTPAQDRVRVKPKRGIKLNAIYDGIEYNLYSSGIYIPIDKLNSIISIFFIVDENQEEG